jgi:hypothetical protein
MTDAHRNAVIATLPSAAEKTQCLDPEMDIPDPIGRGMESYVQCARNIHTLVRARCDELDLQNGPARLPDGPDHLRAAASVMLFVNEAGDDRP